MALRIQVIRGDGDKQGPDIANPLLPDEAAARELGRVFIDTNYSNRLLSTIRVPFTTWIPTSAVVRVEDMQDAPIQGLRREVSLSITRSEDVFCAIIDFTVESENVDT